MISFAFFYEMATTLCFTIGYLFYGKNGSFTGTKDLIVHLHLFKYI